MTNTPNFNFPLLYGGQDQKDVTINQALTAIDRAIQLNVTDRTHTAPPGFPADGDKYIVAVGATGVWTGYDNFIAIYTTNGATWTLDFPRIGWTAFSVADNALYTYNGSSWVGLSYIPYTQQLIDLSALTPTVGNVITGDGAHWVSSTQAQALGLTAVMMALIYG
jgi:hypothetical protein